MSALYSGIQHNTSKVDVTKCMTPQGGSVFIKSYEYCVTALASTSFAKDKEQKENFRVLFDGKSSHNGINDYRPTFSLSLLNDKTNGKVEVKVDHALLELIKEQYNLVEKE